MKRIMAMVSLALLLAAWASAAENTVLNEDFEHAGGNIAQGAGVDGSRGLTTTNAYGFAGLSTRKGIVHGRYRLTFQGRGPDGKGAVGLILYEHNKKGARTSAIRPKGFWSIRLADTWQEHELTFSTSWPDASHIHVAIYNCSKGHTVQLDNFRITLIEPVSFRAVPPGRRVEMLQNGGFENGKEAWGFSFNVGTGSAWEVVEDPKEAHSGSHYALVRSKGAVYTYLSQKTTRLLHPNVTYRLGVWVKGKGDLRAGGKSRTLTDEWQYVEWTTSVKVPAIGSFLLRSYGQNSVLCYDDCTLHADKAEGEHLTEDALPEMRTLEGPETPHVKWANPLRGGGLRVLFVLAKNHAREVLEVAQRLELSAYDVVPIYMGRGEARFGIYMREPNAALLRSFLKKNEYDCLVMGHVGYWHVPPDVQDMIIQKVNAGMGLIWTKPIFYNMDYYRKEGHGYPPKVRDYFLKGAKHAALGVMEIKTPRMGALHRPKVKEVQKGRFAYVPSGYWGLSEQDIRFNETYRYWEYQFAAWARLIRWAAHRDPEVQLTAITHEGDEFHVKLKNTARDDRPVKVSLRVVNRFEKEAGAAEKKLTLNGTVSALPSGETVRLTLGKALPAGMHFVQVIVYDEKGRVHDFGAVELNVLGAITFASAEPTSQRFETTKPVGLRLVIKNDNKEPKKITLTASLEDAFSRKVTELQRELTLQPGENKTSLSLEPRDIRTVLARARLALVQDGRTLHEEMVRAYLRQPRTYDDFIPCACYGYVYTTPTYLMHLAMPVLRDIGIRVVMGSRDPETEAGLRTCPMNAGGTRDKDGNPNSIGNWNEKLWRGFCLHDPEDLEFGAKGIHKAITEGRYGKGSAWRKYTPIFYGIWDEPGVIYASSRANVDLCWNPHTLNAFRQDLKRTYKSLDALNAEWETNFTTWNSVIPMKTEEVRARKNIAPWMDFRMFMSRAFAAHAGWAQDIIRKADGDPNVPCGANIHGVTPYCCTTHYYFSRHLSMAQTYPHSLEANRSFYQAKGISPNLLYLWTGYQWGDARYRYDCWWVAAHGGAMPAYFIEPVQNLMVTGEIDSALSAGLGVTKMGETMRTAFRELLNGLGKALLTARILMPEVANSISYERTYRNFAFGGGGGDFGADPLHPYQVRSNHIVWQQIESGELKRYKVLIGVPEFVSDKALRKILEFVDGGGILVGRVGARYDEHGKPRTDRTLVEQLAAKALKAAEGKNAVEVALTQAGVRRGLRLSLPRKQPAKLDGFLVTEFRRGPITYFVVLRSYRHGKESGNRFEAHFADDGIVYEARSHKCYGRARKVEFELEPSYAKVFAVLPYNIKTVGVKCPRSVKRGKYVSYKVSFEADGKTTLGDHAVHVEVLDPQGQSVYALQRNLLALKGAATHKFLAALNDTPGKWTIRVTDPISGAKAERSFTVR